MTDIGSLQLISSPTAQIRNFPRYRQIASELKKQMLSGQLPAGTQLQTERNLAKNFNVSLLTLRQALSVLEEEGMIERQHGKGTFVGAPKQNRLNSVPSSKKQFTIGLLMLDYKPSTKHIRNQPMEMYTIRAFSEGIESQGDKALFLQINTTRQSFRDYLCYQREECGLDAIIFLYGAGPVHIDVVEEMKIPYIVYGNVLMQPNVPRMAWDWRGFSYVVTKTLIEHYSRPVWLVNSIFYQYEQNILMGYRQAIKEQPELPFLFYPCDQVVISEKSIDRFLSELKTPASLIFSSGIASSTFSRMRATGINPNTYPTAVMGEPATLLMEDCDRIHFAFSDKEGWQECTQSIRQALVNKETPKSYLYTPVVRTQQKPDGTYKFHFNWQAEQKPLREETISNDFDPELPNVYQHAIELGKQGNLV